MTDYEVFHDKNYLGKDRPWRKRKLENITYSEYLKVLHFKKANNVHDCGNIMRFKKKKDGHYKLYQAWFCKSRLCPLCNWRRSRKNSYQISRILEESHQKYPHGRFLFLTLTSENTYTDDDLKISLKTMGRAVSKMFQYKKVAKNLLGYCRSTEITVHTAPDHDISKISYHQHMHIILFVKNTYFEGSKNYISQKQWTKYWQKAMKLSYKPVVYVEIVKPNRKKGKNSLIASANETAKYQVKSDDILGNDVQTNYLVINDFEKALSHIRAISYGKLFNKIKKRLFSKTDDEDLINTDDDNVNLDDTVGSIIAKWNYYLKNYYIVQDINK